MQIIELAKSVGLNSSFWVYLFLIGPILLTVRKFDNFHKEIIRDRKLNQFKEIVEDIKDGDEAEKQLYTEILAQERFRATCKISATKSERKELSNLLLNGVVTIRQLKNCWEYMVYDGKTFFTKVRWLDTFQKWYSILVFVFLVLTSSAFLMLALKTENLSKNLHLFVLPISLYILAFLILLSGAKAFLVPYLQKALDKYYKENEPENIV